MKLKANLAAKFQRRTNTIDLIFMILRLNGWLAVPHWGRAKNLAYHSYGIAASVLVSVSALEQIRGINDRFSIEEYGSGFTAIAQVVAFFFVASFTVLFAVCTKRLREFDTELKRTVALAMKYSPKSTSERYDRSETHSSLIVLIVLSAFESSVVLWFCMTLYDHLFLSLQSTGKSPRFAFPWLFYGLDPHREFWIILALQFMHGLFCSLMVALGFAFPPAMCTLLQGQIEILKESLPKARDSAGRLILSGFDSKRKIGGEDMEDQVDLRDCIVHHQMILRLLRRAKAIMTPFLFFSVMFLQIMLATLAVASASIDERHSILLAAVEMTLFSSILFIEAMYITNLRDTCSEVGFLAYSIYLKNHRAGKDLLLVVYRSNRQEKFSCFFTSSFTSKTVFKILNMVWNFFTIAKGMEEKLARIGHLSYAHRVGV